MIAGHKPTSTPAALRRRFYHGAVGLGCPTTRPRSIREETVAIGYRTYRCIIPFRKIPQSPILRSLIYGLSSMSEIAIFSPFLRRQGGHGGVTPWLTNLATGLQRRGIAPDILVSAPQNAALRHDNMPPGVSIINLGRNRLTTVFSLISYLRRSRPRVLLAAGYRYNSLALTAARFATAPLRVYASVHENVSAGSQELSASKRRQRFRAIARTYPRANGVIAVSHGVAEDLIDRIGLPPSRIKVIYNPVVPANLAALMQVPAQHPWLQGDGDPPVILGVGRLERQKDFPTLLRAFARINVHRSYRLIILGEGSQRGWLTSLIGELGISDAVSLPGHVSNPYAYMARSVLFVLSSRWEGFGNVLAEALAAGIPAISTDCPSGPREILKDGVYGPLVPVGDVTALAETMTRVLQDPLPASVLRARGQEFAVEACVDAYIDYLGLARMPNSAAS
jgi:glycosyltransferase involved in cell wall biosynthesis